MASEKKPRIVFRIISWALYDLANQFFVLNITGFYFARWVILVQEAPELYYSIANAGAACMVALLAPYFGRQADVSAGHLRSLRLFTGISVVCTAALALTDSTRGALLLFVIANIGCQLAVIFYNALMFSLVPDGKSGLISGIGKAAGYAGAIIALWLSQPVFNRWGYQGVFLLTGVMFFIFSLPCLLVIREPKPAERASAPRPEHRNIIAELWRVVGVVTGRIPYGDPALMCFLRAAFLGLCVVNVIMLFMSIYATRVFGLSDSQVVAFVAYGAVCALLGSVVSGMLSDRLGYGVMMRVVYVLWVVALAAAIVGQASWCWLIGAGAGVALGSTWVVSRALIVSLISPEQAGEVFGMFNVVGYAAGIIGPLLWGVLLFFFAPLGAIGYRLALSCFLPFLLIGLRMLPVCRGSRGG